jgi:hypothetical protein
MALCTAWGGKKKRDNNGNFILTFNILLPLAAP